MNLKEDIISYFDKLNNKKINSENPKTNTLKVNNLKRMITKINYLLLLVVFFQAILGNTAYAANNLKIGSTYYDNLAEAVSAASSGATIMVQQAYTDNSSPKINKKITIHTNGLTLTKQTNPIVVNSGYTLSITGTGTITGGTACNVIENNGTLNLTNATIRNWSNSEDPEYAAVYNNGTFNINSGTVSAKIKTIINMSGTINFKGGTIISGYEGTTRYNYGIYAEKGTINCSGGRISVSSTATDMGAIGISARGAVNITLADVEIHGESPNAVIGVEYYSSSQAVSGTLTINSGTDIRIRSTNSDGVPRGIKIQGYGSYIAKTKIVMNDGSIIAAGGSDAMGIQNRAATGAIKILGGTITSDNRGIVSNRTENTITIGDLSQDVNKITPTINAKGYGLHVQGTFTFDNGIIKGPENKPYLSNTATISRSGYVSITAKNGSYYETFLGVPNYGIGDKRYETLEEALSMAVNGNTIDVLQSYTDKSTANIDKNVTINTNALTVTKETTAITINSGYTLNVIGTGTITGGTNCNTIKNEGTFNLTDATIRNWSSSLDPIYSTIKNTGTITINSGVVSSKVKTIQNDDGTINLKGGRIEALSEGTYTNQAIFTNNGTINITGGSVVATGLTTASGNHTIAISNHGNSTIIISNATISAEGAYSALAIECYSNSKSITGTITLNSGTNITASTSQSTGSARGIKIQGESVTVDYDVIMNAGSITVNGDEKAYGIQSYSNAGEIKILKGNIEADHYGIISDSTSKTITIGNTSDTLSDSVPMIYGRTYGVSTKGEFAFNNGGVKGTRQIPYVGTAVSGRTKYAVVVDKITTDEILPEGGEGLFLAHLGPYYTINGNPYASLQQALSEAVNDNTILVVRDVPSDVSVATVDKNVTLNTNGFNVNKDTKGIVINSGYTLSITGTGSITGGTNFDLITNNGTLNLTNTTINSSCETASYQAIENAGIFNMNSGNINSFGVAVRNTGTANIKAGEISAKGLLESSYVIAISNKENGELNITGGTISAMNKAATYGVRTIGAANGKVTIENATILANGNSAIAIEYWADTVETGSVTINAGTTIEVVSTNQNSFGIKLAGSGVTINVPVVVNGGTIDVTGGSTSVGINSTSNSGTISVYGGTIQGDNYAVYSNNTEKVVTIGSKDATYSKTSPELIGGTYGVYAAGGFDFGNGVIKGSNKPPYNKTATVTREKYEVKTTGPSNGVYSAFLGIIENYGIGSNRYYSLEDAIAAASDDNTIVVLKDVIDSSTAKISKNLTLDTNEKTITKQATTITIDSGKTLSIIGAGKIAGDKNITTITNSGTFNLTDATISFEGTSTSYFAINNSGTVTMNSGKVSAPYRTIKNTGTLNIKDGLVEATADDKGTFNKQYISAIITEGTLNISGGTVSAVHNSSTNGVRTIGGEGGDITISGGTVIGIAPFSTFAIERYRNTAGKKGSITISGNAKIIAEATTESGSCVGIYIAAKNRTVGHELTINMTGGEVIAKGGPQDVSRGINVFFNMAPVTITGGIIKGDGYGVYQEMSTSKLTIGNATDTLSITNPEMQGEIYGVYAADGLEFNNGVIKAKSSIPFEGAVTVGRENHVIQIDPSARGIYSAYLGLGGAGKSLITEWTIPVDADGTAGAGTTITLPIPQGTTNTYLVDWGDGQINGYNNTLEFPTHTYKNTSTKTYTIKVDGKIEQFGLVEDVVPTTTNSYANYYTFTEYLTGIKNWGEVGVSTIGFVNCLKLIGTIPEPMQKSFENVTSMANLFYNCNLLDGQIPTNLFSSGSKIASFANAFNGCSSLDGAIPEVLFRKNKNTIDFTQTFKGCTNLSGAIPGDLFINNINVTTFNSTFNGCTGLTGMIPERLFLYNDKINTMISTFEGCTGLTAGELQINTNSVTSMDGMLKGCTALESVVFGKETKGLIGTDIFANCSALRAVIFLRQPQVSSELGTISDLATMAMPEQTMIYVPYEHNIAAYEGAWSNIAPEKIERIVKGIPNPDYVNYGETFVDDGYTVAGFGMDETEKYTQYGFYIVVSGDEIDTTKVGSQWINYILMKE